jgi:hypothetical protein
MSTKDQLLYSALHGTAMRCAAERRNLDESIEELRQIADGRDDILAEAAGITAGSWYASPASHVGYELVGAGMLILAGGGRGLPLDYVKLERWTRVGYERGMRSRKGRALTLVRRFPEETGIPLPKLYIIPYACDEIDI